MDPKLKQLYASKAQQFSAQIAHTRKHIHVISVLRLGIFIAMIVIPYQMLAWHWIWPVATFTIFLTTFLLLVKTHGKLSLKRQLLEHYKTINQNEELALEHQFDMFDAGDEFTDPLHPYTNDLDIFGPFSIFQFLNRTATLSGKKKLAQWLSQPLTIPESITDRQQAIRELSPLLNFRQDFAAHSMLYDENQSELDAIDHWASETITFKHAQRFRLLGIIIPSITLIMLGLLVAGQINFNTFMLPVASQWILLYAKRKEVSLFFKTFGKQSAILSKYNQLFKLINTQQFNAPLLNQWQNKLQNNRDAGRAISELKKQVELFDARLNILVGAILNSLFLWDINRCLKLYDWHRHHHQSLIQWMEVPIHFDALNSLANFTHNNPNFTFPVAHSHEKVFEGIQLGHPLIPANERVNNDFALAQDGQFAIITGANMAGKSTFLRTVGVNLVLAQNGAPVCAQSMTFVPKAIFSHMRTTDDLAHHESYFFAELKRLKVILETLKNDGSVFILLDEILRGTNSKDKLTGSEKYLQQLIKHHGVGIIATHDLKLTALEAHYPTNIINSCFEIDLSPQGMNFSYKLTEGVTQTMNATFLMKQMGLITD